ncbi:unnamed protein product [Musa acuminata subsp. burmannicoides]
MLTPLPRMQSKRLLLAFCEDGLVTPAGLMFEGVAAALSSGVRQGGWEGVPKTCPPQTAGSSLPSDAGMKSV